jgi:hypothetical protein
MLRLLLFLLHIGCTGTRQLQKCSLLGKLSDWFGQLSQSIQHLPERRIHLTNSSRQYIEMGM